MTTLLLVRHAETTGPPDVLLGRNNLVGLSRRGVERAGNLARQLDRLPATALFSSPLRRAIETAAPIAERLTLSTRCLESLNEVDYGTWTGRSFVQLEPDPQWRSFNHARAVARVPGGETIALVERRIDRQLRDWFDDYPAQMIIAVTHAELIRIAVLQSLGLPSDHYHKIEVGFCSVTVLRYTETLGQLVCLNESGTLDCLFRR